MSVHKIKALNKQDVHPPMNFHELQKQLLMFTVASVILFGELSVGVQCLKSLANMMNHQKSIFKAKERFNEEFPAKFLLAVDTRVQIWLNDCKLAKNRDIVDDSIIHFRPLVNQVIFGSSHMILPPTFSMKSPKATKTSGPEDTGKCRDADEDKCNKKKGKGNDDAARSLVKNESPHGEICMLANETWVANFAGKQLDQRPQWNDKCKCCPCWLLQTYCFSDCPNKESHVPAKQTSPAIFQQMLAWVKACRK
jgi:hypothetical protein